MISEYSKSHTCFFAGKSEYFSSSSYARKKYGRRREERKDTHSLLPRTAPREMPKSGTPRCHLAPASSRTCNGQKCLAYSLGIVLCRRNSIVRGFSCLASTVSIASCRSSLPPLNFHSSPPPPEPPPVFTKVSAWFLLKWFVS